LYTLSRARLSQPYCSLTCIYEATAFRPNAYKVNSPQRFTSFSHRHGHTVLKQF